MFTRKIMESNRCTLRLCRANQIIYDGPIPGDKGLFFTVSICPDCKREVRKPWAEDRLRNFIQEGDQALLEIMSSC